MTEAQIRLCKATAESIMKIATDQTRRRDPKKIQETLGIWYAFGYKHSAPYMIAVLMFLPPEFAQNFSATTRGVPTWSVADQQSWCQEIADTQPEFTADQFIRICRQFTDLIKDPNRNKTTDLRDVLTWIDNHSH